MSPRRPPGTKPRPKKRPPHVPTEPHGPAHCHVGADALDLAPESERTVEPVEPAATGEEPEHTGHELGPRE